MFLSRELPDNPPLLDKVVRERLSDRQWILLSNESAWHQQFYKEVTVEIDENIFSVLYSSDGGRPNSPIYLLVCMLILKEGKNWTDEVLFRQCHFNLQVRCALGLGFGDDIPCEATYNNFKASLKAHAKQTGVDLLQLCYRNLTSKQCKKHGVKGAKIRMDSKLLDANIAMNSRLELVLGVLMKFYKSLSSEARQKLSVTQHTLLENICKKQPHQHRHSLSKAEQSSYLEDLGMLVYELCESFEDETYATEEPYLILAQLWEEQYELVSEEASSEQTSADITPDEQTVIQSKKKLT